MCKRQRNPFLPLVLFALSIILFLAMVSVSRQAEYLTRGIPEVFPDPISSGGAKLGINVSLEQYNQVELLNTLEEIKGTNFEAVKQSFYYEPDFSWEETDRLVDAIMKSGLQLVPILDGNPSDYFAPPTDHEKFAQWAGQFADRYGDFIDFYMIWDEPNLTSHWGNQSVNPDEYAALFSTAAESIRAADPIAKIVLAPLAPTVETGPKNLAAHLFLQELYEAGSKGTFDVVAGKPYGFNSGPYDREVDPETLNFSQIILLREVMERNNDSTKAIWAGNWGWNSLPSDWTGPPSIWGEVDEDIQADWTLLGLERARQEWPWMGFMFLENWEPAADSSDPSWGFSVAGRTVASQLRSEWIAHDVAYPGFHPAVEEDPKQIYSGDWRFSPDFGADVGQSGDSIRFEFWGTEIGLGVRRSNLHARFYATVDGFPANQLPLDDSGASLILNSPDPSNDHVLNELVASNLEPGKHTLEIIAHRASDQWALSGFTVGFKPSMWELDAAFIVFGFLSLVNIVAAVCFGRNVDWRRLEKSISSRLVILSYRGQLLATSLSGLIVVVMGWLTWNEQSLGIYRRLGDVTQIALTGLAASIFYIAPSFLAYLIALLILFILIYLRPAWGLALVAFSVPFYVKPKPMAGYLFSPVEIFLLVTLIAVLARILIDRLAGTNETAWRQNFGKIIPADWAVIAFSLVATISLIFTARLDVATNEWRVLIIEPAILYFLFRFLRPKDREMWTILDAFILGAVTVGTIGLWQYFTGQNLITSEGGLMRLRSVYGSPNNVALYLGRIIPILVSMTIMGSGRRRISYTLALVPVGLAMILSFSKGAFFLGLPAALLLVLILWRRSVGGRLWPWLIGAGTLGLFAILIAFQIPQLAGRLNPQGATGFFRMNLWQSTINMIRDHPVIGVGLDNFLYEYRGRYILEAAWQEPNLSHPHNLFLDFTSRLGILGLASGIWLFISYVRINLKLLNLVEKSWYPVTVGTFGSLIYILAHGLVDHSYFLVDLAYAFVILLALNVWLLLEKSKVN
jgi:O-antigen ligase